jgi:hypothetical protein
MSGDDELERLLREVDASLSGTPAKAPVPATASVAASKEVAAAGAAPGRWGRSLRTGLVAGVVCGAVVGTGTFLLAWLPFIDNPFSSAAGAFVGAFATGAALTAARG